MPPKKASQTLKETFADLCLHYHGEMLAGIDILACGSLEQQNERDSEALRQLRAYFTDPHYCFHLKLDFGEASAFQRRVWAALQEIPAGRVMTYGYLAARLGTSARAIGAACRSNPIPIIVPCHRVVAAQGLGGYMGGRGLAYKHWLLHHEGVLSATGEFLIQLNAE
jgi:methylated-DNA-[protein]-cysteine S-methyltransferase